MAWFRKDNKVSVKEFLTAIKSGNRNFIDTLKLKETDFHDASFEELMSNTDDVIAGVNRVQKNFSKVYFNIFNNCLIKHHDDGDVKFLFYTVTKDATSIIRFSSELFDQLAFISMTPTKFSISGFMKMLLLCFNTEFPLCSNFPLWLPSMRLKYKIIR
jgi:hypothetical protein